MKKAVLVLLIVCFSTVAFAQEVSTQNRLGIFTGYYIPSGKVKDGLDMDFNPSMNYGIEYSYAVDDMFSIGMFLENRSFSTDSSTFVIIGTSDTVDLKFKGTSTIFGVSGTVSSDIEDMQVFATGKLGYALNKLKGDIDTSFAGSFSEDESKSTLAVILEAGARYKFTNMADLGFSVKYTYNKQDFGSDYLEDSIDLGGIAFIIGAGYRF